MLILGIESVPCLIRLFILIEVNPWWLCHLLVLDLWTVCRCVVFVQELPKYLRGYHNVEKEDMISLAGLLFRVQVDADRSQFVMIPRMMKDLVPADQHKLMSTEDWKKVWMSICPVMCLSVHPSIHLPIQLSVWLPVLLSVCINACLSVWFSI